MTLRFGIPVVALFVVLSGCSASTPVAGNGGGAATSVPTSAGANPSSSGGTTITDVCAFISGDPTLIQTITALLGGQPTLKPTGSGGLNGCDIRTTTGSDLSVQIDSRPSHASAFFDLNASQPGSTSIPNLGDKAYWQPRNGGGANVGVLSGAIALYVGIAVSGLDQNASVDAAVGLAETLLPRLGI